MRKWESCIALAPSLSPRILGTLPRPGFGMNASFLPFTPSRSDTSGSPRCGQNEVPTPLDTDLLGTWLCVFYFSLTRV